MNTLWNRSETGWSLLALKLFSMCTARFSGNPQNDKILWPSITLVNLKLHAHCTERDVNGTKRTCGIQTSCPIYCTRCTTYLWLGFLEWLKVHLKDHAFQVTLLYLMFFHTCYNGTRCNAHNLFFTSSQNSDLLGGIKYMQDNESVNHFSDNWPRSVGIHAWP